MVLNVLRNGNAAHCRNGRSDQPRPRNAYAQTPMRSFGRSRAAFIEFGRHFCVQGHAKCVSNFRSPERLMSVS